MSEHSQTCKGVRRRCLPTLLLSLSLLLTPGNSWAQNLSQSRKEDKLLPFGARCRLGRPVLALAGLVQALSFSTDGNLIAACGLERSVRVFHTRTGTEQHRFDFGGFDTGLRVAFSPDGSLLAASACHGQLVFIWSLRDGRLVHKLSTEGSPIALIFAPDGSQILAGTEYGLVYVWQLPGGKLLRRIGQREKGVLLIEFLPDVSAYVAGKKDSTLRVRRTSDGQEVKWILTVGREPECLAISQDGKYLALATATRHASVVEIATGTRLWRIARPHSKARQIAFSPDGSQLILGVAAHNIYGDSFRAGAVEIVDARNGKMIAKVGEPQGYIYAVAWSPDGRYVASSGHDGGIRLRFGQTWRESVKEDSHRGEVSALAFTPDSRRIVTAGGDRTIKLWDLETGNLLRVVGKHEAAIESVDVSPCGKLVASGSADDTTRLWELLSGEFLNCLPGSSAGVPSVAFLNDGKLLASASGEMQIHIWDISTGKPICKYPPPPDFAVKFLISPDGKHLLALRGIFALFEATTGKHIRDLPEIRYYKAAVFSPDSTSVAVGAGDGGWLRNSGGGYTYEYPNAKSYLRIYDIRSGAEKQRLEECQGGVISLAYSKDGRHLITGSSDGAIRVWNLQTGKPIRCLNLDQPATCLRLSPNGQLLAAGLHDGTTLVWAVQDLLPR